MSSSSSTENLKISLQEIFSATNNFAEENIIGRGGYGLVYRGQSERHGMLAIKRLDRTHGQGDHEYGMEIRLLSKYKHENLVSLVGFCGENKEKILVYKYEANQSLDKFLNSKDLSWIRRLEICLGAARGLRYLHTGGPGHGVIHRDIKSANILLDEHWKAKIADFGLSKIALTNSADSVFFTNPCGTGGYFDPQILIVGTTQKSDVYSFGVVLYEVLFGKLATVRAHLVDGRYFTVEMAKKHYEKNTLDKMIDADLRNQINSDSLSLFSKIAYECLQIRTEDRPTMGMVVEALEKALRYASGRFLYDVYICFHKNGYEKHLRKSIDSLCEALESKGLFIYKGNIKGIGNEATHLSAINQSGSFIIVFSKDFTDSSWNLDELVEVIKCVKERGNNSIALPIYVQGLDPSDVREQKSYLANYKDKHSSRETKGAWRNACVEAANLPGLQLSNFDGIFYHLAKKAAEIVKDQLLEKDQKTTKSIAKDHTGKEENVDALIECVKKNLGFSEGKPVAAFTTYKCLIHWNSFEAERTSVFDRLLQMIGSVIGSAIEEDQVNNETMAYWLSNTSTLLFLLQRSFKADHGANFVRKPLAPTSQSTRMMMGFRSSPSIVNLAPLKVVSQVEAKYPALSFKKNVTSYVEKTYTIFRDNLIKELHSFIALYIEAARSSKGRSFGKDSHWKGIIDCLNTFLITLKENYVPPIIVQQIFTQTFSYINVQLFNNVLLSRVLCTFHNGEYVKSGLAELERWCWQAKEAYAGSAWDELKHMRQVVVFLVRHHKDTISYDEINDLCPILSVKQRYRLCTLYMDDNSNTQTVSSDVISSMRIKLTEDSNNVASLLLDEDSSIPISVDVLSSSLQLEEFTNVKPAVELAENPAFQFLHD